MEVNDRIRMIADLATVAQCAAETGELDPSTYASVFELIAEALHDIAQ